MSDHVAEVEAARQRTVAAGTARLRCTTERSWHLPDIPPDRSRGAARRAVHGTGRLAGKGAWRLGRGLFKLATRNIDVQQRTGDGVIDFAGRRSMIDQGSFAMLQVGNQEWNGRSGRVLGTLPAQPARPGTALWLLDLLAGATDAEDLGPDETDGQHWRHLAVTASLADASARAPEGLPSPEQERYERLLALPLDVWLDDQHVRRIRFSDGSPLARQIRTATFSAFGTPVDELDWSRLPTFRSPEEAEGVRRQRRAGRVVP